MVMKTCLVHGTVVVPPHQRTCPRFTELKPGPITKTATEIRREVERVRCDQTLQG